MAALSPSAAPGWRLVFPTAVTLASVACAGTAVYMIASMGWDPRAGTVAHPQHLALAAWAILAAEVFDTLDGLVARLLKATSDFGLQLDSLADALSFGATPALLVAVAAGGAPLALVAALALLFCAVLRVARYNVEKPSAGPPPLYFKGLATPGAGGALAAWVLLAGFLTGDHWLIAGLDAATRAGWARAMMAALPAYALLIAGLMVSDRRYPDLPKHYMRRVKPWWQPVALVALGVATAPEIAIAAFFIGYSLVGLVGGRFTPSAEA